MVTSRPNLVVLCDFDGTITLNDTYETILRKFARGDWQAYDRQYAKGEITLEECARKQALMVRASRRQMISELERVTSFRRHFDEFANYCQSNRIPLIIVSAGLDFVIRHFLRQKGLQKLVKLHAPKAECRDDTMSVVFPRLLDEASVSLKDDIVKRYQKKGDRVLYIGDGIWDFPAVRVADSRIVVRGSKLAKLCLKRKVRVQEMKDFGEVINTIQSLP